MGSSLYVARGWGGDVAILGEDAKVLLRADRVPAFFLLRELAHALDATLGIDERDRLRNEIARQEKVIAGPKGALSKAKKRATR